MAFNFGFSGEDIDDTSTEANSHKNDINQVTTCSMASTTDTPSVAVESHRLDDLVGEHRLSLKLWSQRQKK